MIKKGDLYYPSDDFKKKALIKDPSVYKTAAKDPIKFWEELAEELTWRKKWQKAFEHKPPYFKWFAEGEINITENCLDRNLKERGDKIALIWEPELTEEKVRTFTYRQLFEEVNKFANALRKLGVRKGDRVGIYLPMVPEVVISMLSCARIGAVHTVVFSAFSPTALQTRLIDSEAKILITADGYYRNGGLINLKNNADAALLGEPRLGREGTKATSVEKIIVVKRAGNEIFWQEGRDFWWQELVKKESRESEPEMMDSEDPLFILYTSGSTGKPKGCLHATAGYMVQAYATSKWIFDLHDDDIFWSTADIGWITGHTYSCYGPLLCGATFVIFEGLIVFPGPDRWAKIIDDHKITIFYTAPTAIRMFEKNGAEAFKDCKLDTLRLLGSVGEPIDESAWLWYFKEIGKERCPIVDTWWQTESGGILITSLPGIGPFKPAFTGLPFPGTKFDILDDEGNPLPPNKEGNLVLFPPFSPGLLRGIYKDPQKYLETYWSQYVLSEDGKEIYPAPKIQNKNKSIQNKQFWCGVYFSSDGALRDENGLIRIIGRVDDVIKVAGHRIATGELEAVVNLHPEVSESAVVGIPDEIKGEVPVAFISYRGEKNPEELKKEIIGQIKKEIGPIALPREVYLVDDLPKTRSGKIMRRVLKRLFTGEELGDLSTLSNPESVEKIKQVIKNAAKI